jgi:hypothetical protein
MLEQTSASFSQPICTITYLFIEQLDFDNRTRAMSLSKFKLPFGRKPPGSNSQKADSLAFNEGDSPPVPAAGQPITALEARELRDLILLRYRLDVQIWSDRKVGTFEYEEVEVQMRQADAVLQKINATIESWHDKKVKWPNASDRAKLEIIKRRLALGGKRQWEGNPPWNDPDREMVYDSGTRSW